MSKLLPALLFCIGISLHATAQTETEYAMPAVPDSIQDITRRADYATRHFWDAYPFADTTLVHHKDYAEQAAANFFTLLPYASDEGQDEAIGRWLEGAAVSPTAFSHFAGIAEKYLYERESPQHNEALYQRIAERIGSIAGADEATQSRAHFLLQQLRRNRPDSIATDFTYATADGTLHRLSQTAADRPTLLLFYDPDCQQCQTLLFRLRHSGIVNQAVSEGRLAVLAVYTEDDEALWQQKRTDLPAAWTAAIDRSDIRGHALYDLRQLPTLYLLSPEKRVILRDATLAQLTNYLLTGM